MLRDPFGRRKYYNRRRFAIDTQNLTLYKSLNQQDYDQTIKLEGTKIQCYSPKQMEKRYPEDQYTIVGETKRKNKKERIASLQIWRSRFVVSKLGANSTFLYRRAGFVCVGQDQYIVLLKHRFAFLIWFFGLLAGLLLCLWLLWTAMHINDEPEIIDPDHPLPTVDGYAVTIPEEENHGDAAVSEKGGGSVSMIYTLSVDINLKDGTAKIDFRNPSVSNHDIALILYAISGEEEYPLAQSGLVKAGSRLETMNLIEDAVILNPGIYTGKYKVLYYDAITGEKALVEPEITDLVITVTE